MNEDHNNQASESAQPETQSPQPEPQPAPTRLQKAWESVSNLVDNRTARIAAKVTATVIVLALGVLGYRHYQPSLSWNRES